MIGHLVGMAAEAAILSLCNPTTRPSCGGFAFIMHETIIEPLVDRITNHIIYNSGALLDHKDYSISNIASQWWEHLNLQRIALGVPFVCSVQYIAKKAIQTESLVVDISLGMISSFIFDKAYDYWDSGHHE